ncbi:DcaP family trimeric outer membrane transporter [Lysobacter panacisoli]|uniref:DcaP family trimeric outer membrane transporter n=1 Tax=Lysobacter panacisoli TaxID=1255263 RepID=A0ABP9KYI7_9GAMM|nr:DcaP family trimeric outer membrane transporter [Lysobacter panacisoli]
MSASIASMSSAPAAPRRRPLAAALLVALALPGMAFAQTAKEKELEARVAQLEAMVKQLVSQQQQQQTQISEVKTAQTTAPAAPAAAAPGTPAKPTIQSAPIMATANPGTRFSYGGFIKLDASVTDTNDGDIPDGTVGRLFYVPKAIPVGGGRTAEGGTDTDMGVNFSRFWFGADTDLDSGDKLKAYLEFDLFGGGSTAFTGNEIATNTYALTLRQAYVQWNNWLAGQTWTNFQDTAALPDTVDFLGPTEGTVFVRQAQLRYTNGPWSFSMENPETVYTPFNGNMAQVAGDDGPSPDFTGRYTAKGDWGHFGIAGLVRQLKYQNGPLNQDNESTGYGLSVSGKFNLGKSDDIRYMVTGGSGIGRYIGLALNNDAVLDSTGDLDNIDVIAGFVGWRHVFSPKLRTNLFYSRADYDQDTDLTGLGITKGAQSAHVNLIYTPLPKLDLGAELIWGQRELENGDRGELNRLQTHVKYNF